jgi:hypothetical protein
MTEETTADKAPVQVLTGFDLAYLDTLTLSEAGVEMPVIHPRTNKQLVRADGAGVYIKLLGSNSETYRTVLRRIALRRTELQARGASLDDEHMRGENVEVLVACTRDWNFDVLDGKPFPYSEANARKFWSDRRFALIFSAAISFVGADVNFLAS